MAGLFSDNTLERIRAASDIVDVIGGYLPLKRAGANFTALCPFHKEKSPSFNVNPHKQIFHCFGCHKGGDVFSFVKEYENIGFVDAVRRLAERAKIPIETDQNPAAQESRHLKDTLLQLHEQITQRWQSALANEAAGQIARDYLAQRGVSEEAVKLFRLGAAPEAWDDTVNWAKSKGHDLALVEKAGLILKKEGSDRYYDRFRGRLMFPICDEQGRVIGFSGRVLSGDEKTAKYVNSPETPIFIKGKVLFALDKAKRAILDIGYAIVCEGQLDTIMCHMHGIPNVVAPQGTALTAAHARIIRRYTDNIILCFDGDAAGQKAAVRPFDDLVEAGIPFGVSVIPPPDDPDSFIKKNGRDKLVELILQSKDYYDFYLDFLCQEHDTRTDAGKQKIAALMKAIMTKCPNSIIRDTYAQKTALRLGVTPDAVRAEFKKTSSAPVAMDEAAFEDATEAQTEMPHPSTTEFQLLKLTLMHEASIDWLAAHLNLNWIQNQVVKDILSRRLRAHTEGTWRNLGLFLDGFDTDQIRSLITEVTMDKRELPNPEQQLADIALRLRNQFLDGQIAVLMQRISQPEMSDSEKVEMLREQQQLKQLKRRPLAVFA